MASSGSGRKQPSGTGSAIDELISRNLDLEEKLETLRLKRQEDRKHLFQLQQLTELKYKIQLENAELQRLLEKTSLELKETKEAFDLYKEETSSSSFNVEMAVMDKEMAEMRVEELQQENSELKERVTELEKQVISMDEELASVSSSVAHGSAAARNSKTFMANQLKQLEEQNATFKEAIVRLRDLHAVDRENLENLETAYQLKDTELQEYLEEKDKLTAEIANLQEAKHALTEQLDASMWATEMVDSLTRKNIDLEDRVTALEDERHDLEQLRGLDQQLLDEQRLVEVELREKLDMTEVTRQDLLAKLKSANHQSADAKIQVSDLQQKLATLSGEIANIQQTNGELTAQISRLHKILQSQTLGTGRNIDNAPLSEEAKGGQLRDKQIELELSQIEARSLRRYVDMLLPFLPEKSRQPKANSEVQAIEAYLTVVRLVEKAILIPGYVAERFGEWISNNDLNDVGPWSRDIVIDTSEPTRITFSAAVSLCCADICLRAGQMLALFDSLRPDQALNVASSVAAELLSQEQQLDGFIELLNGNQLDETFHLNSLCQPNQVMRRIFESQLASVPVDKLAYFGDSKLIMDTSRLIFSAGQLCLCVCCQMLSIIPPELMLLPDIAVIAKLRIFGRKMLQISRRGSLILSDLGKPLYIGVSNRTKLVDACNLAVMICNMLKLACTSLVQQVATNDAMYGNIDNSNNLKSTIPPFTLETFNQSAEYACQSVFGKEGPGFCGYCHQFIDMVSNIEEILGSFDTQDSGIRTGSTHLRTFLSQRAEGLHAEIAENRRARRRLLVKESEVFELKNTVKVRQDDIDELTTKTGLLERRLESCRQDADVVKKKYDQLLIQSSVEHNDAEHTLEEYRQRILQLQTEQDRLEERLLTAQQDISSEVPSNTSLQNSTTFYSSAITKQPDSSNNTTAITYDSPLLLTRIADLETACEQLFLERNNLRMKVAADKFACLKPLRQNQTYYDQNQVSDVCRRFEIMQENVVNTVSQPIGRTSQGTIPKSPNELRWLLSKRCLKLTALHQSLLSLAGEVGGVHQY